MVCRLALVHTMGQWAHDVACRAEPCASSAWSASAWSAAQIRSTRTLVVIIQLTCDGVG